MPDSIDDLLRLLTPANHPVEAAQWEALVRHTVAALPGDADQKAPQPWYRRGFSRLLGFADDAAAEVASAESGALRAELLRSLYSRFLARRAADILAECWSTHAHLRFIAGFNLTAVRRDPILVVPGGDTDPDVAAAVLMTLLLRRTRNPGAVLDAARRNLEAERLDLQRVA